MAYSVPDLPYDYNALEPHVDEATMRVHHDKHHAAYVTNANAALEGTEWAEKPVEEMLKNLSALPQDKQTPVRNNAGGHYNHSLFWQWMSPNGGGEPSGDLGSAIGSAFGSFDDFKAKFKDAGIKRFGSGWAWLIHDGSGSRDRLHGQPGQPDLRRQDATARRRRLGARVLPQVPEQAPGLPRRVVERRQLGQGGRGLLSRRLSPVVSRPRRIGRSSGGARFVRRGVFRQTAPLPRIVAKNAPSAQLSAPRSGSPARFGEIFPPAFRRSPSPARRSPQALNPLPPRCQSVGRRPAARALNPARAPNAARAPNRSGGPTAAGAQPQRRLPNTARTQKSRRE